MTIDVRDVRFFEAEESDEEEQDDDEQLTKNDEVNGDGKGEVMVKANGLPINAKVPNQKEGEGIWEVTELKSGTNILEVGEMAGEIWKIILQRIGVKG
jgi:hypothetical protein